MPHGRWSVAAVCLFLLLAVALAFSQTLRHEFIHQYDDEIYVCDNPQVAHGFTAPGIAWAFTHCYVSNWHPLTWLSHMLDCQLYGLSHPGGHHLTNILLHAANVVLLFLVLRQMTGGLWRSAFVATLFAIHPLHVESVAWVAERKDVLSGLFFMLTLAAYARYAQRPFSLFRYLLVAGLFALGLMAKPMLVTLPFVLLLLDYWPLGRIFPRRVGGTRESSSGGALREPFQNPDKRLQGPDSLRNPPFSQRFAPHTLQAPTFPCVLLEKLTWLALAAASCMMTYFAQKTVVVPFQRLSFLARLGNALVSYVAYLGQFFYPAGLAVFYPHPQEALPIWQVVLALLVLAGISLAVLAGRRNYPYLLVGWLWYVGTLVPVIGLVQVGAQAMADRYTYLTQIGLYLALAWSAERVSRHWRYRRWLAAAVSALVVMSLVCCAWQQASYWKDDEALWSRALACTSNNWLAHGNFGITLAGRGRMDEAIAHYREALRIKPSDAQTHNNLGRALADRGEFDEALAHYGTALELKPEFAGAHNNFGLALAGRRRFDEAIVHYQAALRIQPDYAEAHYNLGNALAGRGDFEAASAHFLRSLKIVPGSAEAHNNLGLALAIRGRFDEALVHYQEALRLKPNNAETHYNMGNALASRGEFEAAVAHFQRSLEIAPGNADVRRNLEAARRCQQSAKP